MKDVCQNCKKMCCKADISFSPVVTKSEIDKIEAFLSANQDVRKLAGDKDFSYFDSESKTFKLSKFSDNRCVFWNPDTSKCRIYPARPLDCKIFPFEYRWFSWMYAPHCPSKVFNKKIMLSQFKDYSPEQVKKLKLMHLRAPESTKDKLWIFILKVLPIASIYEHICGLYKKDY